LHMVSAWGCDQRLVLAQIATDAKSNEITAMPSDGLEQRSCAVNTRFGGRAPVLGMARPTSLASNHGQSTHCQELPIEPRADDLAVPFSQD
jgi:hypothetical protein